MKCATPGKYKRKTLIERGVEVNMKEYINENGSTDDCRDDDN